MQTIDSVLKSVRSSAVLTTSYVAGTAIADSGAFHPREYNQLVLYVNITLGSLTSVELKVEFDQDPAGGTLFQETAESLSGTTAITAAAGLVTHQFTATGKYRLAIPIADQYIKVSVKGTGTTTNSLCAVDACLVKNYA